MIKRAIVSILVLALLNIISTGCTTSYLLNSSNNSVDIKDISKIITMKKDTLVFTNKELVLLDYNDTEVIYLDQNCVAQKIPICDVSQTYVKEFDTGKTLLFTTCLAGSALLIGIGIILISQGIKITN